MAQFFKAKKSTPLNLKHQSVDVVRLDNNGAGIAFVNNKPVFIDGVLPEEKAIIQFTEQKKQYARARLIKLQKLSQQRTEPICEHYGVCGGCNLQHLQHSEQVVFKNKSLQEIIKRQIKETHSSDIKSMLVDPITADNQYYRRRVRVSVRYNKKTNQLDFGFRKKQSQSIINIRYCPMLVRELNQHLDSLYQRLNQLKGKRDIGHIELVQADNGTACLIRHLAPFNQDDYKSVLDYCKQRSLTLYLMPESDKLEHVVGDKPYYKIDEMKLYFTPKDFIQVNQRINEAMVQQALEWLELEKEDCVLDLFCGLGNFSLPLAKRVKYVVGIEGIKEMVQRARTNAVENQLNNIDFYQADLECFDFRTLYDQRLSNNELLSHEKAFNKIVLDPARAGAASIIETIVGLKPKKIVYVSCNPSTLARDSQLLLEQGYKLIKLGMLDMFPNTGHLESMALFEK